MQTSPTNQQIIDLPEIQMIMHTDFTKIDQNKTKNTSESYFLHVQIQAGSITKDAPPQKKTQPKTIREPPKTSTLLNHLKELFYKCMKWKYIQSRTLYSLLYLFSYRTGGAIEIEEIYDILKGKLKKSIPFKKYYILVSFAFLQTSV